MNAGPASIPDRDTVAEKFGSFSEADQSFLRLLMENPEQDERLMDGLYRHLDIASEAKFLNSLKLEKLGQWLGSHHGDRLLSLTLCATAARIGSAELWNQRIEQSAREGMAALVDGVAERWFTAGYRATPRPEVEQVRAMILATPAQGYGACCAAIRDMDQSEAVRSICTPTLLVAGADDPATTVEMMRSLHERIPGSRLVEIAQAAHLVNIEQPERFNRALTSFLDAQSRD